MELKKRENIGWIDLLRVIACFLVVLSHSCDAFVAQFSNNHGAFLTGTLIGSSVRACVPLFVMMTGVLMFPVRYSMTDFYKKRIGRIVVPLIFWSLALPILYFVYLNYGVSTQSPSIDMANFTSATMLNKMYTFIFNFNYDTTPLWYLYMLVGLYLVIPILNSWLENASQKDIKLFLYVWGISLFIPYIKIVAPMLGYTGNYGNMGLFGVCDWNEFGTFYYVSGFIGYIVLAYYLMKYPLDWSWKKTLSIAIPLFLIGYLITAGGFILTQEKFPGSYANLEIIWYFAGINVFMMTFAIFVIVQKLKVPSSAALSRLAAATFGVYLCHFIFVQMAYDLFDTFGNLPAIVRIPAMACIAFFVSYLVVRLFETTKLTRRLVR